MSKIVEVKDKDNLFSPYSGKSVIIEDEINESDKTLAFVYYGMIGDFAYVSEDFSLIAEGLDAGSRFEEFISSLDVENLIVIKVDSEWNGVNYFGFIPK